MMVPGPKSHHGPKTIPSYQTVPDPLTRRGAWERALAGAERLRKFRFPPAFRFLRVF